MASTKRSDGEGSVYQRHKTDCEKPKDTAGKSKCACPWQAAFVSEWRDGKPVRKKVTAKTRAAAIAKMRERRTQVEAGQLPKGRPPTVAEWMHFWLEELAAPNLRPNTLRGYRTYVNQYIVPLLGGIRLDKLTVEDIERAWKQLQTVGRPGVDDPTPLSSTSANQAHRILTRALRVALARHKIVENVAKNLEYVPQPRKNKMTVLSKSDAERLLDAAVGRRNAARWRLALTAGLRQGEALGLKWSDIDFEDGVIRVSRALARVKGEGLVFGPVKSQAGERAAPLVNTLNAELQKHRALQNKERLAAGSFWKDHDLVFAREDGRPLDPRQDWGEWKELLKEAGLPSLRLHDARHHAATMMLAAGASVRLAQEWMGHSSQAVTQKYQHVIDDIHRDGMSKLNAHLEA